MNKQELQQAIKEWRDQNKPLGDDLGYPSCCVEAFCQQPPVLLKLSKPTDSDNMRYKAACIKIFGQTKFTGFIPCHEHAKQILAGKIKLNDLIDVKRRKAYFPTFPHYELR